MKRKIAGKEVELYDSIEDLPILRFHKYNKMMLIDAGIGTDVEDVSKHISRAIVYARRKETDKVLQELQNTLQSIYFVENNLAPRFMSFAVLVKSIDGKPRNDISDEGLKETFELLQDARFDDITSSFEEVKKKIDEELRLYYPNTFEDATLKEYYDLLRQRTLLVLENIKNGGNTKNGEISELTDELLVYFNPQSFNGKSSEEIRYDKKFEDMCLVLSQHLHINPKSYSTLEFYNAYEFIKKEFKRNGHGK